MKTLKCLLAIVLLAFLAACGGGGGSPGTVTGSSGSNGSTTSTSTVTAVVATPTASLTVQLADASGASTVSVNSSGVTTAKATVKDATGAIVANRLVTFASDATKVTFPGGATALTNASGVASVQVAPASLLASGAATLSASALVGTTAVTGAIDFQLAASNLTLTGLNLGATSLPAYGNRAISVQANVNGAASTASPVQVTFSANCGTVEPVVATTNGSGIASITYKADGAQGCGGNKVVITASAVGAQATSGSLDIALAPATNLQFVSATPALIYLAGSGGTTQAQVKFKVVNANGDAQQGVNVQLSLVNSPTGVSIDTIGSSTPVIKTTDLSGMVSVPVFSGSVPTPLQVKAVLVANSAIETTSSILTVASGRPTQLRSSLAVGKFSIEGASIDGKLTDITMSLADRQGNPVPDGTVVNFVTEGGVMIPATCVIAGGASSCTVQLRSQNPRPADGRVSVLAYVQGEEDFIDANFNNRYDAGEAFTDLGNAYRDDNENGLYDGGEFTVPRAGSSTCAGGAFGRPNTCDGVWGAVDVRQQAVVIFATSVVKITGTPARFPGFNVSVADLNGNSAPTDSSIAAAPVGSPVSGCTLDAPAPAIVPNSLGPLTVRITPQVSCATGDIVRVTVRTPSGVSTSQDFVLP